MQRHDGEQFIKVDPTIWPVPRLVAGSTKKVYRTFDQEEGIKFHQQPTHNQQVIFGS